MFIKYILFVMTALTLLNVVLAIAFPSLLTVLFATFCVGFTLITCVNAYMCSRISN